MHRGELYRIPDVVKCLREFPGQAGEFISWKKSVERVLQIYSTTAGLGTMGFLTSSGTVRS